MKEKDALEEVVNLDAITIPPNATTQPPGWVSTLTIHDENLLMNGEWLNDSIINAGQQLIQQAFPHVMGLQDVALGHTLAFCVELGEFV